MGWQVVGSVLLNIHTKLLGAYRQIAQRHGPTHGGHWICFNLLQRQIKHNSDALVASEQLHGLTHGDGILAHLRVR